MNSQNFNQDICRVCLDKSVALDWNTTLYGYYDVTYKDCFYKYTQLECPASDPFPSMLCQICLNGLYNTHTLILNAIESHKYFQEIHFNNSIADISTDLSTEFETVLIDKIKKEPVIQDHFDFESSNQKPILTPMKTKVVIKSKRYKSNIVKSKISKNGNQNKNHLEPNLKNNFKYKSNKKTKIKSPETLVNERGSQNNNTNEKLVSENEIVKKEQSVSLENELLEELITDSNAQVVSKKKRYKELKKPRMCSICSKILQNIYAVRLHEKTHMENRERKETCKVCGLKFYDKRNLYAHNRIHVENREKRHKCEFCSKAFFNKGGLNIHRRIHLGQMIPCNLCSKQFFRQIDLERHMGSHSATTINSDTKKRSRYFVRCEYCGKSILSTSFKSHTAAHLNEPLMKCSICNKEFFRRGSCVIHVKKVHQKTNDEYNNFIIQYKKNRMSHLFLEQKADIQFTDE